MELQASNQRNLLIVDDETSFLKLLARIFQKRFNVRTASSGEEALQVIKDGFLPGVILSDQRMPNMTGDEFLHESIELVPEATRIILTGYTAPKDIISCVNKGQAFMYLTKPSEELELVQAIRLGFERYESVQKSRKLIKELKQTVANLEQQSEANKQLIAENKGLITQTVQALAGLLSMREKYYFQSHSHNVAIISKYIAQELEFSPEAINVLVLCSLLHGVVNIGMPLVYQLTDPFDLDVNQQSEYFKYFNKAIANIEKIRMMDYQTRVLSQIWEHNDGSGHPKKISGRDIALEAQIIAFANIYHNKTYRLTPDKLPLLRANGVVVQSPEETRQRHSEAIKFFYRRANWYNVDVTNAFHDLIKKKECPSLIPYSKPLMLNDMDSLQKSNKYKEINDKEFIDDDDDTQPKTEGDITIQKKIKKEPVEHDIAIDKLTPGMVVAQNVATKNGILIVRQDNVLTKNLIQNIIQMEKSGMLYGNSLTILLPPEED